MITGIILAVLALLVLLIATYTDFKTGEVPDWLSFSFIISALGIRLLHSVIYSDWLYFLYGGAGFGIMCGLALLMFYARQWGGGDAKIMMGLGAAFATAPFAYESRIPYLFTLSANIFIAGGVYGLLWGIYVFAAKYAKAINAAKENIKKQKKIYAAIAAAAALMFASSFFSTGIAKPLLFLFPMLGIAYMLLYIFIKASEAAGMYKLIPVSKLTEGDWVASDIKVKTKLVCSKKDPGITKGQIKLLKAAGVKSVVIKKGIKFLLALLAGAAVTLIYNKIIILAFL